MKGIKLKMAMNNFGVIDGFSFWFKWSIIDSIRMFVWLNITHKEWCSSCGFYCGEMGNCTQTKKLRNKKEILARVDKSMREEEGLR